MVPLLPSLSYNPGVGWGTKEGFGESGVYPGSNSEDLLGWVEKPTESMGSREVSVMGTRALAVPELTLPSAPLLRLSLLSTKLQRWFLSPWLRVCVCSFSEWGSFLPQQNQGCSLPICPEPLSSFWTVTQEEPMDKAS